MRHIFLLIKKRVPRFRGFRSNQASKIAKTVFAYPNTKLIKIIGRRDSESTSIEKSDAEKGTERLYCFHGRPWFRRVNSSPSNCDVWRIQSSPPNGRWRAIDSPPSAIRPRKGTRSLDRAKSDRGATGRHATVLGRPRTTPADFSSVPNPRIQSMIRGQSGRVEERSPIRFCEHTWIEDYDDPAVGFRADQPAEALFELDDRLGNLIVGERIAAGLANRPRGGLRATGGSGR